MPEGHTIHRIARDHRKHFQGEKLRTSSPQGRFEAEARQLDRRVLINTDAHGKHLFYDWDNGSILHVHLGLYGKFRLQKAPMAEPRGQVRLRAIGSERGFDLNGPNCCELISDGERRAILERLGPDPLRKDADPDQAWTRISRSKAAIGNLLLNQSVMAGVGNVYRAEALFVVGIHPDRPGKSLSRSEFDQLWELLGRWLKLGVKYNRIITADAKRFGKTPSRLNKNERLLVYKKATCTECGQPVTSWSCGARTVYACTVCQKD